MRGQNSHADYLAMLATSLGSNLPRVFIFEDMVHPNFIEKPLVGMHSIQVGPSWMDPLVIFLKQGLLLEDMGEAEKICRKAPRYWLFEGHKLYKRSHSGPYLLCVHPEVVEPLLEELHEGICGSYTSGRSLAYRALTQGYWWSSMQKTFQDYVKKCNKCQRYALIIHQPGGGFMNPFPVLGLSLSGVWTYWGHFLEPQEAEVVLVGIGYFTKWVEFEPLYNIRDVDAKRFIWRNVITKFGVPHTLISDNVLQFDSKTFRRYCGELGIRNRYSTPTMGRMRLIIRL